MQNPLVEEGLARPHYWRPFESLERSLPVEVSLLRVREPSGVYVYESGPRDAPRIALVSPGESPFLLISSLFRELSRHFRVVSFDHPGSPFMEPDPTARPATTAVMAETLLDVLEATDARRAHIVTWCVGALPAVWALTMADVPIASLSLIAPPSSLSRCLERTHFQRFYLGIVLQLASGTCANRTALCRWISRAAEGWPIRSESDRLIYELTHLPVRNDESVLRYAHLIKFMTEQLPPTSGPEAPRSYADIMDAICARTPVALLHCLDDDVVTAKCSANIAERNPGVRLELYPTGSHFVIFKEPAMLAATISDFVRAHP
jgi:pimeloyl-ACP methyl ester carboxylesterase